VLQGARIEENIRVFAEESLILHLVPPLELKHGWFYGGNYARLIFCLTEHRRLRK
jgi:hypothetical protein